jgi:hypothetical protein
LNTEQRETTKIVASNKIYILCYHLVVSEVMIFKIFNWTLNVHEHGDFLKVLQFFNLVFTLFVVISIPKDIASVRHYEAYEYHVAMAVRIIII